MSDVLLAVVNMIQVIALAYIALRQATVKRDLDEYNGKVESSLDRIHQRLH